MIWLRIALFLTVASPALAQPQQAPEQDIGAAVRALDWKAGGPQTLAASKSVVTVPDGYRMVVGDDARRLLELAGNPADPEIEADVVTPGFEQEVMFEFFNVGFVTVDDWGDVDPGEMISAIRENTENENKNREARGVSPIHVVGWLKEPTLDRASNAVYWAIEADDGGPTRLVNSIALKLGRSGYEKLIWITDKNSYKPQGGALDVLRDAHTFNTGSRYSDYVTGDRLAGYGVAALVGAVAGAKLLKVGVLTVALLFLKKFAVLAVVAAGAVMGFFKRLFKRGAGA